MIHDAPPWDDLGRRDSVCDMTTTRPRFLTANDSLRCNGRNHTDHAALGSCSACGADVVKTDKGRVLDAHFYTTPAGYERRTYRCWATAHECDAERAARWEAATKISLDRGELIVTQHVTVTKGRKIAKGTEGTIRWVGEGDYGLRVGLDVEGHDKLVYVSADNVTATNQLTAPAEIVADVPAPAAPKETPGQAYLRVKKAGSHAECTHEPTKAGRAACRKARQG